MTLISNNYAILQVISWEFMSDWIEMRKEFVSRLIFIHGHASILWIWIRIEKKIIVFLIFLRNVIFYAYQSRQNCAFEMILRYIKLLPLFQHYLSIDTPKTVKSFTEIGKKSIFLNFFSKIKGKNLQTRSDHIIGFS